MNYVDEIRERINRVLDQCEVHDLPMPYTFEPDGTLGTVEVSWILADDLLGSRLVIGAFPGTWTQHRGSSVREPILEWEGDGVKIVLWAHPESIVHRVELP